MTSRHGVHAKDQLNVRLPPELLARLKDGSKRHGQTVTDIVTRGTATELDRLDAETAQCPHRIPPGAWCKTCKTAKPEGGKR